MQDHGASHAIIQHHNRATIEGEMATGMLEQLYIEWGGYYVKTLQESNFFFFTFLVKLWTPEKFFIPQKNRVGETRGKPLKLVFGYVYDFNLNCCGAVFFSRTKLCPKRASSCASSNSEVQTPVYTLVFPFLLALHVSLSLSLPRSSSLCCLICRTFLWKQSFVWDHWTFILIFFATWSKQSIVVAQPLLPPTEPNHLRFTSGHRVLKQSSINLMTRQGAFDL